VRNSIVLPERLVWVRFTTHVDNVGILCYIIATVLDAVVFLVIHDVESISVFIRKDFLALVKTTDKPTIKFRGKHTILDNIKYIQVYLDTCLLVLSIHGGSRHPSLVRCDEKVDTMLRAKG
jgi:hypothetical protein